MNRFVSVDDSAKLDVGEPASTDRASALFNQLYSITWALHLLYEEIKLDKVGTVVQGCTTHDGPKKIDLSKGQN